MITLALFLPLISSCEIETPDPAGDFATLLLLDQLTKNPSRFGFSTNGRIVTMHDTNQDSHNGNGFACDTGGEANNCIIPSFYLRLVGNDGQLIDDATVTVSFNGNSTELTTANSYNPVYFCDECPALAQGQYITDFVGETVTVHIQHPERGIDATGTATLTRQFDSISLNGSNIFPDSVGAFLYRDGEDEVSWERPSANTPPLVGIGLRDGSIFDGDANSVELLIVSDGADGDQTILKDLSALDSTAFGSFGHAVGLSPFTWTGTQPQAFEVYDDYENETRRPTDKLLLESVCNSDGVASYSCDNPDSLVSTDLIID
ncbi:MAG: hypothetical protein KDK25_06515 [Leptospiraceae bacterium]|nr:hypothetical protein [Leptospiraceae bacterium]